MGLQKFRENEIVIGMSDLFCLFKGRRYGNWHLFLLAGWRSNVWIVVVGQNKGKVERNDNTGFVDWKSHK